MSPTKPTGTRVDEGTYNELQKLKKETGISPATFIGACLRAGLDHYREFGSISFPLKITDATALMAAKLDATLREKEQEVKASEVFVDPDA